MDGTVTPDGEVGTWGWAKQAPTKELRSWLVDGCDPERSQHITVLVKVGERLGLETGEMVDIIFAAEEEALKIGKK